MRLARKGKRMKVTYIHHSAFCVEVAGMALVFDYYRGDGVPFCKYHGTLPEFPEHTQVYVFSSHSHRDHFDVETLGWCRRYPKIHYIFAKEAKKKLGNRILQQFGDGVKERITYVKPGGRWDIGGIQVETLTSTDIGVAFVVTAAGKVIYHAGDLHWWKWEGEPEDFNDYQEKTYQEQIGKLSGRKVDLAFVVLDPRLEKNQFLGIGYFMEHVQAAYVVPMHLWKQYGLIQEYKDLKKSQKERDKIIQMDHENQVVELP